MSYLGLRFTFECYPVRNGGLLRGGHRRRQAPYSLVFHICAIENVADLNVDMAVCVRFATLN